MPKPAANPLLVKKDTSSVYANYSTIYVRFNFTIVDNLPNYSDTDTLLSGLPTEKAQSYFFIMPFDGNSWQRCIISNGNLQLLYGKKLEAGKTYNATLVYPAK